MSNCPVAAAVRAMMDGRTCWSGTATGLLAELSQKPLAANPRALSVKLRKAATSLRADGIDVEFIRDGKHRTRTIRISAPPAPPLPPPPPRQPQPPRPSARPPERHARISAQHDPALSGQLSDIAQQVARLSISHRDPERFHIEKSEVVHQLRKLARRLY